VILKPRLPVSEAAILGAASFRRTVMYRSVLVWTVLLLRAARWGLMQVRDVVLHKLISDAVAAVWLVSSRPGLKDGTSREGKSGQGDGDARDEDS
jgi:hypothetical protein